jgi:YVTN family beta-propeller protein
MSEMPTGAVTFLFSDIEGSTRLVKQLRDRYGEVLHEHQRLLRQAFEAHRGYEVDTQGDSFFVAFASARDALLAAVEGQLALASHPWPDGVAIKVRMGLHTGQAVASGNRYTGLAVHRAARIGAAAHGGQILVSQATQTLLEDEEEDLHIFLRDLGEQRLKDLERPVRLYQAAADGLPASFPPLRPAAELAQAAEVALRPVPLWRRPLVLGTAALAIVLALVVAVLATRGSGGGLSGIDPNQVGVIDPHSNRILAQVPVGLRPGPITAGAGAIWVGNLDDRTLTKVDPQQRTSAGAVTLGDRTPTALAAGAVGVWVVHGALGTVSRVDPQFARVTSTVDLKAATGPNQQAGIAVAGRSVWVVLGNSTLARIDGTRARIAQSGFAGSQPSALVVAYRAIWVANAGDATVQRFNPSTFDAGPVRTVSVGERPVAIAFGEGAVWVANASDDTVTRIDPNSGATTTIRVGGGPAAIAAGAGAVWVANKDDDTISRIDTGSNNVVRTIALGNAPAGLAFANGYLWASVQAP